MKLGWLGGYVWVACNIGPGLQTVDRTPDAERPAIEHVCVDHRRAHVPMAEQLLDGPNVITVLEEMRRERMAAM